MTSAGEMPAAQAAAAAAVEAALAALGLTPECPAPGSYLVRLEGQRKLATMTWLIVGAHSLQVEAFFCRSRTRTTPASTGSCWSATAGCTGCTSPWTSTGTST